MAAAGRPPASAGSGCFLRPHVERRDAASHAGGRAGRRWGSRSRSRRAPEKGLLRGAVLRAIRAGGPFITDRRPAYTVGALLLAPGLQGPGLRGPSLSGFPRRAHLPGPVSRGGGRRRAWSHLPGLPACFTTSPSPWAIGAMCAGDAQAPADLGLAGHPAAVPRTPCKSRRWPSWRSSWHTWPRPGSHHPPPAPAHRPPPHPAEACCARPVYGWGQQRREPRAAPLMWAG